MTLQASSRKFASRERNIEFVLLAASMVFALLAWRSLDAAAFAMPADSVGSSAIPGCGACRPSGPPTRCSARLVPGLCGSAALAAVGLAFVTRLAPQVAHDQVNWITIGIA